MTDRIGYESLTQGAMRGVIRDVLKQTAQLGAPIDDHHFFITFSTKAPGVKIADHLVERFATDMTIVIQHQYWDLEVHDSHFEIILKFSGVPQHLHIPFSAITRFVDPSVNFGLSFEVSADGKPDRVIAPAEEANIAGKEAEADEAASANSADTVVNLDAFRRK
ncbi:MAG: ClpXP protease specificity-enhancing factor SspB [Hyphomonadaceae bacterium]